MNHNDKIKVSGFEASHLDGIQTRLKVSSGSVNQQNLSSKTYLYQLQSGYRLSSKNNSSSAYALSQLDTDELIDNNSWKSYGKDGWQEYEDISIKIFVPEVIEQPKAYNISCRQGNIDGLYIKTEENCSEKPIYQDEEDKTQLQYNGNKWLISDTAGSNSSQMTSDNDGDTAGHAKWSGINISELDLDSIDASHFPKAYHLISKYGNIEGGFKLTKELYMYRPVQQNEDDKKYLQFSSDRWNVSDEVGGGTQVKSEEGKKSMPHEFEWEGETSVEIVEIGEHECDHEHFLPDSEFPCTKESLGESKQEVGCVWKRGIHLNGNCNSLNQMQLFDTIEPTDICQGSLGDCWLLSAISGLAEYPNFIHHVTFMDNNTLNENGNYAIKLWDVGNKDWMEIIIDDKFPCYKKKWYENNYKPLFSQPNGNEFYVLLIEKAFAKYSGSQSNLIGGFTLYAYMTLSGCELHHKWKKEEERQVPYELDMEFKANNPTVFSKAQSLKSSKFSDSLDYDDFFNYLKDCDEKHFLMCASINSSSGENKRTDGLVAGHAYTVIELVEVEGVKLVKLRNPWGNSFEWNGKWGDNSSSWDENPEIKEQVGLSVAEDGIFHMENCDFMSKYDEIGVLECNISKRINKL